MAGLSTCCRFGVLIAVTANIPIWHHGFINTLGKMKDLGTMMFLRMQMRG